MTRVVIEATSGYWKRVFYLLQATGFQTWLVNARDVKHLPGRPKTDKLDAVWLCKVAERQMLRPSFVPPPPIRRLRDLTRYRVDLVGDRGREKNRVEKLLEDAQIKLSVVASDIFGVSGRAMMDALVAGQRDPKVLAGMARTRMRAKSVQLEEAFIGHFTDHHAFLLARMLARIDQVNADITEVEARIEELVAPLAAAVARLDEIPGVGAIAAHAIIAEIGVDMTRFPTPAHLTSWAKFASGVKESGPPRRVTAPPRRGRRAGSRRRRGGRDCASGSASHCAAASRPPQPARPASRTSSSGCATTASSCGCARANATPGRSPATRSRGRPEGDSPKIRSRFLIAEPLHCHVLMPRGGATRNLRLSSTS